MFMDNVSQVQFVTRDRRSGSQRSNGCWGELTMEGGELLKILVFTCDKYKSSNNMLTSSSQWNFDTRTHCPTALTGFEQETWNNSLTPPAFHWNADLGCCLLFLLLGQVESYLIDFTSLWPDVTHDQPILSFYSMTSIWDLFPLWSHWSSKYLAVFKSLEMSHITRVIYTSFP